MNAPTTSAVIDGALGPSHPPQVWRINFRFSGSGRYAVCLTARDRDGLAPELWDLTGRRPRSRVLRLRDGVSPWSAAVPTGDGNILVNSFEAGGPRRVLLAVPAATGSATSVRELLTVHDGDLALVAGRTSGTAALALLRIPGRGTTVWRLSGSPERPEQVADVRSFLSGGVWLDESGDLLALARSQGRTTRTVVLDPSRGTVSPLPGLRQGEHLLLAAPCGGVLLTALESGGVHRLGIRRRDDDGPTVFPEDLNAVEGTVRPLALDPAGRRLALSVTRGACSVVLLYDLEEGGLREIGPATGSLLPAACWNEDGLHVVHSAPDRPPQVVTVSDSREAHLVADGERTPWAPAVVRRFDGPAGPLEAVVYGDPVRAARVVLALHGGPEAAWQLTYDPLFQRLAAEGVAVVAPNQRGSTGYGAAHRDAIRGAWGGPDLADVLHVGRTLAAERAPGGSRPILYGPSYGAYLALLAAAAEPDLWSRAAVVAPFLSGRELYADGPAMVRNLLDRLGGREEITGDALGPRDLLRLADRLRLPLLVIHGERDPIIPVGHSRRLRDRMARAPHQGARLTYLEVPGAGHDPLTGPDRHLVLERLVTFLHAAPPSASSNG